MKQHVVSVVGAGLSVSHALARAGSHKPLASFFRQLVWQLGENLQAVLIKLMLRGSGSDNVFLKVVKVSSIVGEAPQLDKLLVR